MTSWLFDGVQVLVRVKICHAGRSSVRPDLHRYFYPACFRSFFSINIWMQIYIDIGSVTAMYSKKIKKIDLHYSRHNKKLHLLFIISWNQLCIIIVRGLLWKKKCSFLFPPCLMMFAIYLYSDKLIAYFKQHISVFTVKKCVKSYALLICFKFHPMSVHCVGTW